MSRVSLASPELHFSFTYIEKRVLAFINNVPLSISYFHKTITLRYRTDKVWGQMGG